MGFYAMRDPVTPSEIHVRGLKESFVDDYERNGRSFDPLLAHVVAHHVVSTASVASLSALSDGYKAFADAAVREEGFQHYMLAPVVADGALVGMMHFASKHDAPLDARVGSAIALHVSARLSALRALDGVAMRWKGALTARESELAELAARGLSTAEMGRAAGISVNTVKKHLKKLYERLGVASRAELSALLLRGPAVLETKRERTKERRVELPEPRRIGETTLAYLHPRVLSDDVHV